MNVDKSSKERLFHYYIRECARLQRENDKLKMDLHNLGNNMDCMEENYEMYIEILKEQIQELYEKSLEEVA